MLCGLYIPYFISNLDTSTETVCATCHLGMDSQNVSHTYSWNRSNFDLDESGNLVPSRWLLREYWDLTEVMHPPFSQYEEPSHRPGSVSSGWSWHQKQEKRQLLQER